MTNMNDGCTDSQSSTNHEAEQHFGRQAKLGPQGQPVRGESGIGTPKPAVVDGRKPKVVGITFQWWKSWPGV